MDRQQQQAIRLENELAQARESQAAALAELRNSIASRSSAMTQLQTQQSELQQLIEEITRALEGVSSFDQITPLAESRLPPPVDEPVAHAFGATYGGGSLVRKGCRTHRTRAIRCGPTPVGWFLLTGCGVPGC